MEKYILSEIFTLIPKELYTAECGEIALKEQFSLKGEYLYEEYPLSGANAVVAYALPQNFSQQKYGEAQELKKESDTMYPFIVRMLKETEAIVRMHLEFVYRIFQSPKKQAARCLGIVTSLPGMLLGEWKRKKSQGYTV